MAEFKSHYLSLGFYVNGEFYKFDGGRFTTEDDAVIEVLENITDAERVDEPKAEAKPKTARKTSAK
ncbi:hypothetical protein [Priestia megaterium]|uniref:hypothetical protein n=1 Tax=Priestia megaterium TaxID=1404 RepID=UPI001DADFA7C|nr:hypothetical protein [Priestia megaterium]CAH0304940.1 hypothetical protein SRABI82_04691 [Priestia megaterium]